MLHAAKFPRDSSTKWCTIEAFISVFFIFLIFFLLSFLSNERMNEWLNENSMLFPHMHAKRARLQKTVPKFKTSNYWFVRGSSLSSFLLCSECWPRCCSKKKFQYVMHLILSADCRRYTFSSSNLDSHCGNKRWKSFKLRTMPMNFE